MTVSAGVAVGDAALGFERLVARADQALYAAKNAGRNRVVTEAVG
jgi:diguanylate cyclase